MVNKTVIRFGRTRTRKAEKGFGNKQEEGKQTNQKFQDEWEKKINREKHPINRKSMPTQIATMKRTDMDEPRPKSLSLPLFRLFLPLFSVLNY